MQTDGRGDMIDTVGDEAHHVPARHSRRDPRTARKPQPNRAEEAMEPAQSHPTAIIHEGAQLERDVVVGPGSIIYPNVRVAEGTIIEPYCILGQPRASYYRDSRFEFPETRIGRDGIIRSHSVIYAGTRCGDSLQTGHRVLIREKSIIGDYCSVGSNTELHGDVEIGDYSRLHSNTTIAELSKIGDYVWIFPNVVLANSPHPPASEFVGAVVEDYAVIAAGAFIFPGVRIGAKALVGAMALVRQDVAPERVVVGNPAKDVASIYQIRNESGEPMYPWTDKVADYGYPWQRKSRGEI